MAKRGAYRQPVKKAADPYKGVDVDILAIAYNVGAILRKYELLPQDLIEKVTSSKDDEGCRVTIYAMIHKHVKNKPYFDSVVMDAQKVRNAEKNKGIHWFDRIIPIVEDLDVE